MTDELVEILENRQINGEYYKLSFRSRRLSKNAQPGQFMNIHLHPVAGGNNSYPFSLTPLFRRPFSYYRVIGDKIEVLYEILGRGTALLAKKKKGECLKAMGPLGNPFTAIVKRNKKVLIAGGVGVPPLVFLAERFPADFILIGCKSKKEVLPKKELSKVKAEIIYATNDGSYGTKGFVTVLLERLIKKERSENLFIQTCGPKVMMDAVMQIAKREGIEGEASLDETMCCGVGACLGCMVKTHKGWVPSCTKGPVFSFDQLECSLR